MLRTATTVVLLVSCTPALAANAEALFEANGCAACHHPTEDRVAKGLGPSRAQISDAYAGRAEQMVAFLRGDSEPILYPDKYTLMKTQLPRLSALNDEELRSLANYLLSF